MRATAPCPENTYGVAAETFGLQAAPCKACTKNLKSPAGSTSYTACKNSAGFGYTSEGANQVRRLYTCAARAAACELCRWQRPSAADLRQLMCCMLRAPQS